MKYSKRILAKDGREIELRSAAAADGDAVLDCFQQTHGETDFLLTYPEENRFDPEQEGRFLARKEESANEIELIALADGRVVGTAGVDAVGTRYKVAHRAEFGISVRKAYWGLGIGRSLMEACIQCARDAGYVQLELSVIAENTRAIAMYQKAGFVECGRNPRGFRSRTAGYQELVSMRLEL